MGCKSNYFFPKPENPVPLIPIFVLAMVVAFLSKSHHNRESGENPEQFPLL